nr:hypothetical protein [Candidatus Woesearchaeota archaeon]
MEHNYPVFTGSKYKCKEVKMKNKFILSLILGIFLIGLVSSGITSYAITDLQKGKTAVAGDVKVKVTDVSRTGVVSVQVTDTQTGATERVAVTEGRTALTKFGEVSVGAVTPSSLFKKANVESIVVTPTATQAVISQDAEECSDNCQAFTERYKLDEGETITLQGNQISIDFINADSVKFEVNGQPTELFSKNQWFELNNNQIIEIERIAKLEVPATIGHTILGLKGYKLDEGETITLQGNQISINFIDANNVKLDVNGQITDLLNEDNWIELSNGQIAVVEDITKLEVAGTIGYVRIGLASCYFPYL